MIPTVSDGPVVVGKSPRSVMMWDGDPRVIVCAPHGKDFYTDEVVEYVCKVLGCRGLALPHVEDRNTGHRVNVNRPTEIAGVTAEEEEETELAHSVYRSFLGLMLRLGGAQGPELYVEVHGNETQRSVEVATVRISGPARFAVKEALDGMPSGALVEGIDEIVLDADQSRRGGFLRFVPRALHFELTTEARMRENRIIAAQYISRAILAVLSSDQA